MLGTSRKPPPQVTGISPKEGPPGTRVTIRGENLGLDARDLIGLRICGVECLLSTVWQSPNKIIARTGQAKGKGDIIVVTKSGGIGSCTVQFRGYNVQIGPLQDSAVWIDESQTGSTMFGRNRATSPVITQNNDDPLGICDESTDTKIPEDELQELFPEGAGNTSLDNFEPFWFLLENHRGTSFDDLKSGLDHLRHASSRQSEGPLAFAKTNLSTFLDCYDTLTEMHKKIVTDRSKSSGLTATALLEETLMKANRAAEAVFDDVLGRKDRADATRNALGVLNRFKLLFYLPNTIEKNIQKGDYDLVITDYTRAKSLCWVTEVGVFKKVYDEIENRIESFREMLKKKLMVMPSTIEEQKKLIRYLVHLEVPYDPAWECLLNMQKWLVNLMHRCKQEQIDKEEEEEKEFQRATRLSPFHSSQLMRSGSPFKAGGRPLKRVAYVELLTKILCEHVPDFWRLGQSYLSGKLLKEMKKMGRADAGKQTEFKQKVQNIILLYGNLIRSAFLPHSLERMDVKQREVYGIWKERKQDSLLAWLPICVRHVRACIHLLLPLELPAETMDILHRVAFDLRWSCFSIFLRQAIQDIKNLHERETWAVDTDDERGAITMLPTLFENIVSETIHTLNEVVAIRQGEKQLFGEVANQKAAIALWSELLESFAGTIKQLALDGNPDRKKIGVDGVNKNLRESLPSLGKRLIIVLSNCFLTMDHIIPRLVDNLQKYGYPDSPSILKNAQDSYHSLDEELFSLYIEEKANPIIGVLEQNMYAGKFDWSQCSTPTGVRSYIKEAIMNLLEVHAEVYSIGPAFVERVLRDIVEAVADELSRLFQCITKFNANGALQARLDIAAFEVAVGIYKTPKMRSTLKDTLGRITASNTKAVDTMLASFTKQMQFYLMPFKPEQQSTKTRIKV